MNRLKKELKEIAYCLVISVCIFLAYTQYIGVILFGPSKGDQKIIIYTTSWCPYCKKLKRQLDAQNISYDERDIEKSKKDYFLYYSLGGGGVPISVVGEKIIYGYDPESFNLELQKLGQGINQ